MSLEREYIPNLRCWLFWLGFFSRIRVRIIKLQSKLNKVSNLFLIQSHFLMAQEIRPTGVNSEKIQQAELGPALLHYPEQKST